MSFLDTVTLHYADPVVEAQSCRRSSALFDFSFLAVAEVSGPDASVALSQISGRAITQLPVGAIYYGVRRNPDRTLAADLTVWRLDPDRFWLMSGRRQDVADLCAAQCRIVCADRSDHTAVFALQGPDSTRLLTAAADRDATRDLAYYTHTPATVFDIPCTVGRLGYTGEVGFELVTGAEHAEDLWQHLASHTTPAGFTAANILRIEAGFVLFTHEFSVPVTASEVGLSKLVGADPEPPRVRLCCFTAMPGDATDFEIWQPAGDVSLATVPGTICVTSAAYSPIAKRTLGLGYINARETFQPVVIDPNGDFADITIVSLPYYDPAKRIVRQTLNKS